MTLNFHADSRIRELLGEPVDPDVEATAAQRPVYRQLSVQFYPYASGTVWTVITTDRQGHRRWERRLCTGTIPVTLEELHGRDLADVLQLLLRGAVENLS